MSYLLYNFISLFLFLLFIFILIEFFETDGSSFFKAESFFIYETALTFVKIFVRIPFFESLKDFLLFKRLNILFIILPLTRKKYLFFI